ncbi:tetratricopeptide repeat protein, partial [bacterium]|nr:tetratricopeptide repeat protein [bacterium]
SSNKLGLVFLNKNLFKEAKDQFRLALDIDQDYSEVFVNLGRTLIVEDSLAEAVEVLSRGEQQAPNFADIQNYLGLAHLYKQEFRDASDHLQRAVKLNPNYIGAYYHLGLAWIGESLNGNGRDQISPENEKRAMDYLTIASERMTDRQFPNYQNVMQAVYRKSYKEALDEFLKGNPKDSLGQLLSLENEFYLKFMYGGKGKDETFINDYVQRLEANIEEYPNYADLRNNLGVANLIQCRNLFLKALEEFRLALKINPNFSKADRNLKLAENDGKGFLILLRAILK